MSLCLTPPAWRSVVLGIVAVVSIDPACAQDARVRAALSSDGQVWVGQGVTLVVELLAPGYFASAASFDLPDPAGVLLMPPQGHPLVSSETIEGVRYSVQRHELRAWAMRDGEQSIPAVTARFRFKRNPLDEDEVQASLSTSAIPFVVRLPPGAEHLGTVISARHLDVQESWSPQPGGDSVPAGTAFTRTVTFTAPDVPGMVFAPFPPGGVDGIGIYTRQQVEDREDRGSLTGMRRDTITYVCKRPGTFTVPATKFTWFDLDAQRLRTEELPARTLNVVANPVMANAGTGRAASSTPDARTWVVAAAAIGALLAGLFAFRSARVRRFALDVAAPFVPVHLQSLNPVKVAGKETR